MLLAERGIEVVVMRESPDAEVERAPVAVLAPDERERANRFILRRDRQRFIARRARLRSLLGERLGVPAASVRLSSGTHGKPALAEPFDKSGITFNLSHSVICRCTPSPPEPPSALMSRRSESLRTRIELPRSHFPKPNTELTRVYRFAKSRSDSCTAGPARKRSSRRPDWGSPIHSVPSTSRSCRASRPDCCDSALLSDPITGGCTASFPHPVSSRPWQRRLHHHGCSDAALKPEEAI